MTIITENALNVKTLMHWSINLNYHLQLNILNMDKSWVKLIIRQKIYWYFRPGCSKQTEIHKIDFWTKIQFGYFRGNKILEFSWVILSKRIILCWFNALKVWSSVSHPSPTIYLARNTGSSGCSITVNYGLLATAIEVGVELTIRPPKKSKKKLINNSIENTIKETI